MIDWNPRKCSENTGVLEMIDYGLCGTSCTEISLSEDDMIEIRQELPFLLREDGQFINLSKQELYNLIFNFVSTEELQMIIQKQQQGKLKKII